MTLIGILVDVRRHLSGWRGVGSVEGHCRDWVDVLAFEMEREDERVV